MSPIMRRLGHETKARAVQGTHPTITFGNIGDSETGFMKQGGGSTKVWRTDGVRWYWKRERHPVLSKLLGPKTVKTEYDSKGRVLAKRINRGAKGPKAAPLKF